MYVPLLGGIYQYVPLFQFQNCAQSNFFRLLFQLFKYLLSGRISYADGTVYVGEVKDDNRHGHGKFLSEDGDILDGQWIDDEFVGPSSTPAEVASKDDAGV